MGRLFTEKILSQQNKSVMVMQAAGRVGRRADGKEYGTVIDFVDSFGLYLGWYKRRNNIYRKKLGYEVN